GPDARARPASWRAPDVPERTCALVGRRRGGPGPARGRAAQLRAVPRPTLGRAAWLDRASGPLPPARDAPPRRTPTPLARRASHDRPRRAHGRSRRGLPHGTPPRAGARPARAARLVRRAHRPATADTSLPRGRAADGGLGRAAHPARPGRDPREAERLVGLLL